MTPGTGLPAFLDGGKRLGGPEGEDGGELVAERREPPEASGEATRSRAGTEGDAPLPDDALPPGVRAGVREAAPE